MENEKNDSAERRPIGFTVKKEKKIVWEPIQNEEFPLVMATQFVKVGEEWVKFYRVFNSDGEPISGTPRTKDELLKIAHQFIKYLEES